MISMRSSVNSLKMETKQNLSKNNSSLSEIDSLKENKANLLTYISLFVVLLVIIVISILHRIRSNKISKTLRKDNKRGTTGELDEEGNVESPRESGQMHFMSSFNTAANKVDKRQEDPKKEQRKEDPKKEQGSYCSLI